MPYEQRFLSLQHPLDAVDRQKTELGIRQLKASLERWLQKKAWPTNLVDWEWCVGARSRLVDESEQGLLAVMLRNYTSLKELCTATLTLFDAFLTQSRYHLAGTEVR